MIYIGIDPGKNTGLAGFDTETKELQVNTVEIHEALLYLYELSGRKPIKVFIEDARLRKWVTGGREKLQGAGSIKRDCTIWEDALTDWDIPFELVAPKNNKTKLTAQMFKNITGYTGKTSEHARDAAMLVFNRK